MSESIRVPNLKDLEDYQAFEIYGSNDKDNLYEKFLGYLFKDGQSLYVNSAPFRYYTFEIVNMKYKTNLDLYDVRRDN